MGAEDVERIHRGYAAWNRGELDGVAEVMSADVEINPVLGDVVAADRFRGREGIRRWYETIHSALEDFRADIVEVIELDHDRYLVLLRFSGRGKASGAEVALDGAHLVTVRDGLLTRLDGYQSWDEARRAAGLR